MNPEPFIIERTYNVPAAKVWRAITDKDQMKQWYFDLAEFKPEVGFAFSFYGGDENKQYLHLCRVTEVVPGKKLVYSWQYEGDPGVSYVSWELFEEGTNTRLKLTHSGLDTFSKDDPALARENFEQGWNYIVGTSLKEFLEKN